jgi:hypothetical protein
MDNAGTVFCVNATAGLRVVKWTFATRPTTTNLGDVPSWLSPALSPDGSVLYVAAASDTSKVLSSTGAVYCLMPSAVHRCGSAAWTVLPRRYSHSLTTCT